LLLFVLSGLLASACQADPGRKQRRAAAGSTASFSDEGLSGGKLVLEEGFEASPAPSLKPHSKAKMSEGWLHLAKLRNEPPVWVDFALPEKVRIEFLARALSNDGDIKVEVFGDGVAHQSGYILVFGAHKNQEDWFARLDEHGPDRVTRASAGVVKDKLYKMAIVRTDGRVRWFVDGEPFLMFDDPEPLKGEGHRYFAFNNWDAPVEFDELKIFDLGAADRK
jgi:hypothetical protein